ncbi:hypothetical protein BH18ACI1_BH18ACI1_11790 [soil metagenome]
MMKTMRQTKLNKIKYGATKKILRNFLLFCLTVLVCLNFACESPSLKANKTAATQPTEKKISDFERDLETMRTANFDYIFAFRRKDGGAFDGEDKSYLKANLPSETNRTVLSDDDKAVIVGSHFKFLPENLETLRMRFNIADYSTIK